MLQSYILKLLNKWYGMIQWNVLLGLLFAMHVYRTATSAVFCFCSVLCLRVNLVKNTFTEMCF